MSQTAKRTKAFTTEAKPTFVMANAVGDFIRYWGFRRIHGQLWTLIYLSKTPLSGAELTRQLAVSKALVSPALAELIEFKLITCDEIDGRTKKYIANPDVFKVIRTILKDRERKLIKNAQETFELLDRATLKDNSLAEAQRLENLGAMIRAAGFALDFIISNANDEELPQWALVNS